MLENVNSSSRKILLIKINYLFVFLVLVVLVSEYVFFLTRFFPYKGRIFGSDKTLISTIFYAVDCSWFNLSLRKIYWRSYVRKYGKIWVRKTRIQAIFYTVCVSDSCRLSRWNLMRQYSMPYYVYSELSQKYKMELVAKLIQGFKISCPFRKLHVFY